MEWAARRTPLLWLSSRAGALLDPSSTRCKAVLNEIIGIVYRGVYSMLVLTRKVGEQIIIGDNIRLTVTTIRGNQVRLAIKAPAETLIRRAELGERPDSSCGHESGADSSVK
jgi:carbon storage regulator